RSLGEAGDERKGAAGLPAGRGGRIYKPGTCCGGPKSPPSLLLNVFLVVFCGVGVAAGVGVAPVIIGVTLLGIPWARAAITIAQYALLPFGSKAVSRATQTGQEDIGTGPLGAIGNVIWLLLAGWWLALGHFVFGLVLFITIIGIPFGWAHWKLARLALW